MSRAALQRLRIGVAAGKGGAELGALAQRTVGSLADVRGVADVGMQIGDRAAGWGRAGTVSVVPLSVVRDEDVIGVAAPADDIARVVIAAAGVAKQTFLAAVAVLHDAVAAG